MRLLHRAVETLFIKLFNHSQGEFSSIPIECEEGICKFWICWWHLISVEEHCKFCLTSMNVEWIKDMGGNNEQNTYFTHRTTLFQINTFWNIMVTNLHHVLHYVNTADLFSYMCCPCRWLYLIATTHWGRPQHKPECLPQPPGSPTALPKTKYYPKY